MGLELTQAWPPGILFPTTSCCSAPFHTYRGGLSPTLVADCGAHSGLHAEVLMLLLCRVSTFFGVWGSCGALKHSRGREKGRGESPEVPEVGGT